jgi:diaminopimelate epimerase
MAPARSLPFTKMNGLGNEIVVVDFRKSPQVLTPGEVAAIASQPRSHFDQMMVLYAPRDRTTDALVRIYNTDGSEAEACGNGTRCIGLMVAAESRRSTLKFETAAGILDVTVTGQDSISVDMGKPRFGWADIPLAEPFHDTRHIELQVGPIDAPLIHSPSVVNMGNPHAVFWVDRLDIVDLGKVGPMLEYHRLFPERANISLAVIKSNTEIALKTWERGVGLTRACGSAACAAAVSAARLLRTGRNVTVHVPGGPLKITWRPDDHVIMTGPAEEEYRDVVTF